jgi:hypothetical protein
MAFAQGTKGSFATAVGVTSQGEYGVAGIASHEQSLLASDLAPPKEPSGGSAGCALLGTIVVGGFVLVLAVLIDPKAVGMGLKLLLAILTIGGAFFAFSHLEKKSISEEGEKFLEYRTKLDEWNREWVCLQCGARFERC